MNSHRKLIMYLGLSSLFLGLVLGVGSLVWIFYTIEYKLASQQTTILFLANPLGEPNQTTLLFSSIPLVFIGVILTLIGRKSTIKELISKFVFLASSVIFFIEIVLSGLATYTLILSWHLKESYLIVYFAFFIAIVALLKWIELQLDK